MAVTDNSPNKIVDLMDLLIKQGKSIRFEFIVENPLTKKAAESLDRARELCKILQSTFKDARVFDNNTTN